MVIFIEVWKKNNMQNLLKVAEKISTYFIPVLHFMQKPFIFFCSSTGFYMKCNIGLKWVNPLHSNVPFLYPHFYTYFHGVQKYDIGVKRYNLKLSRILQHWKALKYGIIHLVRSQNFQKLLTFLTSVMLTYVRASGVRICQFFKKICARTNSMILKGNINSKSVNQILFYCLCFEHVFSWVIYFKWL